MAQQARESFWHGQRLVNRGDVVADDDPIVKGRETLFVDVDKVAAGLVEADMYAPIEQATANPGEKRVTRRTTRRK